MQNSYSSEQNQSTAIKEKYNDTSEGRVCNSCNNLNEQESKFCAECGTAFEESEKECPQCGELISGIYCDFCGANTEGYICPRCNTRHYTDFCSDCGMVLNNEAAQLLTEESKAAVENTQELPEEKTVQIVSAIAQLEKNSAFEQEQKRIAKDQEKMRQRIILLRERNYFNEREERIAKMYNQIPVSNMKKEDLSKVKQWANNLKSFVDEENAKQKKEREELFMDGLWIGKFIGEYNFYNTIILKIRELSDMAFSGSVLTQCGTGCETYYEVEGQTDSTRITFRAVSYYKKSIYLSDCFRGGISFSGYYNQTKMSGNIRRRSGISQALLTKC